MCRNSPAHTISAVSALQKFTPENVEFQAKILARSGLGENTNLPPGLLTVPPNINMQEARAEFQQVWLLDQQWEQQQQQHMGLKAAEEAQLVECTAAAAAVSAGVLGSDCCWLFPVVSSCSACARCVHAQCVQCSSWRTDTAPSGWLPA